MTKTMTCIGCPLGCTLTAEIRENGEISVTGNTCPRGADYARNELTDPKRILTSVVRVANRDAMLSVKTNGQIPKKLVKSAAKELAGCKPNAPIFIGDIVWKDILGTGIDVIATKNVP